MSALGDWLIEERDQAERWSRGRSGAPRILLLLWLGAILVYLWRDRPQRGLFDWPNLFSGINLGIHEIGHVVFLPLGSFAGILGGSLLQCLAPVAGMFSIRAQGDYFGVAICGGWLATNLFGVATYMADAQLQVLPLVSPFSGHPIHDWNHVFARMGLLDSCQLFGFLTKLLGALVMLVSIGSGSWLIWKMMSSEAR